MAAATWKNTLSQHQVTIVLSLIQIIFIVVFGFLVDHNAGAAPGKTPEIEAQVKYTDFQDVHIALVVGFAFLIAFLRRYSYASFGFSLLLIAFTIEFALIIRGLLSEDFSNTKRIPISIYSLVKADYTAAVVLIVFGALAGKLAPLQYLVVALVAAGTSIANEWVVFSKFGVQDVGGSAVVHLFGAVYGIAASKALVKTHWKNQGDYGSVYHSELISFVGAGVLWVFFPAFNAANTAGDARYRAIVNSYIALVGSSVAAFVTSQFISKNRNFNIRHVVSASLAGGVATGAVANILLHPWAALLLGTVAGIVSILSFVFITPALDAKFNIHDTRGVLSLHGIPGIIGVLASAIAFLIYSEGTFPANTKIVGEKTDHIGQAGLQALSLVSTVAIAGIAGYLTSLPLKLKGFNQVQPGNIFSDHQFFAVPEDYEFTSRVIGKIDHVEISEKPVPPTIAGPTTSGTQEEMINLTSPQATEEVAVTQETPAV